MTDRGALLRSDRLRIIERPFGWVPCRMLTNGTIASMSPTERQLYLVLILAADNRGVSFYRNQTIQDTLGWTSEQLALARAALVERDLLACEGTTCQLLSLPPNDTCIRSRSLRPDQSTRTTPDQLAPSSTDRAPCHAMPEQARHILRNLFGRDTC